MSVRQSATGDDHVTVTYDLYVIAVRQIDLSDNSTVLTAIFGICSILAWFIYTRRHRIWNFFPKNYSIECAANP